MPFSATINLGTVGVAITSVKLYGCTGTSGGNCTGCNALTGYENVSVSTFPLTVSGIPNGVTYIQAEALGACSADLVKQCISISGIPGATPAPTSTMTPTPTGTSAPGSTPTPTGTLTPTPTPSATTPGATSNCEFVVSANIATPTPTATAVYGCGDTVSDTYIPSTFTTQTKYLDLSDITDGDTVTISYTANDRPNRFNIYGNGMLIENSGWVGADNTYAGPWGAAGSLTDPDGSGSFTFEYQAGMSYELRVDVGPANPDANPSNPSDGWSVTIGCTPAPTATSLPPEVTFSVSNGQNTSSSGTGSSTYTPTITVTNGTATIRLRVTVQTGYQADTTLTISGGGSFSPTVAQGALDSTFVDFTLGVGTYTNVTWEVQAISDGTFTVATSTLTQL